MLMLIKEQMETLEYSTTMTKCHGCTNNCRLTINKFHRRTPATSPATAANADSVKQKTKNPAAELIRNTN